MLAVLPAAEHPAPATLDRLANEYGLKDELDGAWAVRPLELVRDSGRTMLVLEDSCGEPLDGLLGVPLEVGRFLRLAVGMAAALSKLHQRGLVHKDIKPANILVNRATGAVKLTGFGIASRLLRERQAPDPPETIAGTLAYMAPEQTGRMNRSIDARSDLYALGVTLYQMLTDSLPFTAADPLEWIHCHIARRPVPPSERLPDVPAAVSAIILKLLAKIAEERYQTAAGVERDLRRCLVEWEARGYIDDFPPGQQDTPDRLLIPEKLYGRAREVELLLATFDRIVQGGVPELVLVSGYSGVGKSSVVNELHNALVPPRGLFASGKFDQYKRDIPYATLAQAFRSLVRRLLGKSDTELNGWRDALLETLGSNGRLMVDVVPELKLIIGDQPSVPELPPQDAQRRFQLVFRRFIGVFARPEHPLALFLDDLQWLDAATLDLLEDLLTRSDLRHLMLIGAYRDNEVSTAHLLMRKLDAIKTAGGTVAEIMLAPLAREHLAQLMADALRCEPARATPLAQLVHEKTSGNPFFAIQFMSSLAEEGMLAFDHEALRWSWDLDRIHSKGYTDNVVDLMVGKLTRLPANTQKALQQLACLGNVAEMTSLSFVFEASEEQVHADLWEAVRNQLIELSQDSCRFVHDRVQEAAYSLIPAGLRAEAHLRIGRLLRAHTPPEKQEEAIFEIAGQLNRGAALITSGEERAQLAELNLIAARRARASTAYASALAYLTAGARLLAEDSWERLYRLAFPLEFHRAECEFLTGDLQAAEQRLDTLWARAENVVDRGAVACLRADLYATLDDRRATAIGLEGLRRLGVDWSPHPPADEARREYERVWSTLGSRTIEALIDLPLMNDPASLATMDLLKRIVASAVLTDDNLNVLAVSRAVNLSLERGNCEASCWAYERLAIVAAARFGDYQAAFSLGRLGYDLVERRGWQRFRAGTYIMFGGLVMPWARHVKSGRELVRRGIEAAHRIGDVLDAAAGYANLIRNMLAAGDSLAETQREAEQALAFARQIRFRFFIDLITGQLALIRTLRGLTPTFGCFDDGQFDERQFENHVSADATLAAHVLYCVRKLQASLLAGDVGAALDASMKARPLLSTSLSQLEQADYHFYAALSRAAACDAATDDERQQHLGAVAEHQQQLGGLAENCPENFGNRAALVGAEIARLEGRELDAERLYEQAIRSAREQGFIQNEGLACELASRFYAARGFETISHAYLRNARYAYMHWGADGKVRQLDASYPHLGGEAESTRAPTGTIGTPIEHLDLATVIKVSQALSGEIDLTKLIDTLMRTAIEQAGAERGLLLLLRGDALRIEAEATTSADTVVVHLRNDAAAALPESVLHYVLRTRESVILDDASAETPFSADPYVRQHHARSILCVPLLNQAKLVGVLYLENNLASRLFAPARTTVLKLLASQAAISLENARLYRDLAEREAKISRLVDANIIGIFIWNIDGKVIDANDAFLRMVGYDREDLVAGRVRRTDMTPPEWRDRNARTVAELNMIGTVQPFEKEYFRKDGTRVPVLIGFAAFGEQRDEGVAFVLDLTERKRAEEALRASEQRFRTLMQFSFDVYWETDAQHRFVRQEFSDRLSDAPPPGSEIGKTRWEVPYLEPDEEAWRRHRETLDAHLPFREFELARPTPGGGKRYVSVSGLPMFDKAGHFIGYRGVGRHTTERKRIEEALRQREKELRQVVETMPAMAFMTLPDGSNIFASRRWTEYTGFSAEDAEGAGWQAAVYRDDLDRHVSKWRQSLASGQPFESEVRLRRAVDGEYRWFLARAVPLRDEAGNILRWYGILADIEDRKRAEAALCESEEQWKAVFENNPVMYFMVDATGTIISVNAFGAEQLGYRVDELIGRPVHNVFHDNDREVVQTNAALCFQQLGQAMSWELRKVRKNGEVIWVRETARATLINSRPVLLIVCEDITEGKRAAEALREAQMELAHANRVATMGQLTASIAHEINQPIAAARNNASAALRFLDRNPPDLEEVREALGCVVNDADRAGDIIGRIRDHIKKAPPRKDSFDLNDAINEVLALARNEVAKNAVSVQTRLTEGLPPVEGDRVQLQQVVLNLILNAVEAVSAVGDGPRELLVSTEKADADSVRIAVCDSGPGIDPENVERVFAPFYTTKSGGLGLGLAICRSIVNAHGGRLWAESNEPRGAVFQFTLPAAPNNS